MGLKTTSSGSNISGRFKPGFLKALTGNASNNPFITKRGQLLFDIYPAQPTAATPPVTRGCASYPASTAYDEKVAAADLFNFQNGVTSEFSINYWIKFNAFTATDTIMCKASLSGTTQSKSTLNWAVELGGTGRRIDFYAGGLVSGTPSATCSPAGITTGIWYMITHTYHGSDVTGGTGTAKVGMYFNGAVQTVSDSSALPVLLNNLSLPFAIGRPTSTTSDGHTPGNFEIQQLTFHNAVLDATTIANAYNSGEGVETSNFASLGATWNNSLATGEQFDFTEPSGSNRIGLIQGSILVDNNTVATKTRAVKFTEASTHALTFQGGIGPSTAPVYTRNVEPWINVGVFGTGKNGVVFDTNSTWYCPTTLLQSETLGSYFWAGIWNSISTAEFYEMNAGDDTVATGEPYGNNHSMFMGYIGSSSAGLPAGSAAVEIRPDGTDMPVPFGGDVNNGNASLTAPQPGNSYPPLLSVPVVIERSCLDNVTPIYTISVNGVSQTVQIANITVNAWWGAFVAKMIQIGNTDSNASSFTLGRMAAFSGVLTASDRAQINAIMATSVVSGAPPIPTGLAAVSTGFGSNTVTWSASTGAALYNVQRSPDNATWSNASVGNVGTSFTDTALTGTGFTGTWFYRVQATNAAGASGYTSGSVSANPFAGATFWLSAVNDIFQDAAGTTPATADGNPVGLMKDMVGTNNASQSTSGIRPTLKLNIQNGLPVIRFDGSSNYLTSVLSSLSQPFTVMMVCTNMRTVGNASDQNLYRGLNGTNPVFFSAVASSNHLDMYGGTLLASTTVATGPSVFTQVWNGASSLLFQDATQIASGSAGTGNINEAVTIGCGSGGAGVPGSYTQFDLGMMVIFPSALSSGNRLTAQGNLKTNWNTP